MSPDAEGRLVLADAISYAKESSPARIIDIATLTGSTGPGPEIWGVIGTPPGLAGALLAAGTRSGEPGWQLPLREGCRKNIRSQAADIRNHQPGMFWQHQAIWAAGATGSGTRTLIEFLRANAAGPARSNVP